MLINNLITLILCAPLRLKPKPTCSYLWLMEKRVVKISALSSDDSKKDNVTVFEQEKFIGGSPHFYPTSYLEATLNNLSKWLVVALFGAAVLCRRDAEAVWAGAGSVVNTALSVILKRILNQERPVSNLRTDPGMPSSHAQSIFYTVMFVIISLAEWRGVTGITVVFAVVSLVFGSYLSWLRVTQQLHTVSQVTVGAVIGSCFCLLWLWSWDAVVSDAFRSSLWVQVTVLSGAGVLSMGFLSYVVRNRVTDKR